MVNFAFNSAIISVKTQQGPGIILLSIYRHFSVVKIQMIDILFHSVLYLVGVCLSGEIHLLQKNECISNVIFVQFNFTHAPMFHM